MAMTAIVLLAALGGASPQDQAPRVETRSEIRIVTTGDGGPDRLDADGDGEVTREEFSAPMGNAFARLDTNDDGRLSTDELAASRGGPRDHVVMRDGPGGPGGPGFRIFTSPMDGPVGRGDRDVRIITRDGGPGLAMLDGPGGPGGDAEVFTFDRGGPESGPGGHQVFIRRFGGPDGPGEMDKDGDGKVSQAEFLAPMTEAFTRMDADGDGFLDDREDAPPPPPPSED